jgi:nitric oxide dioxygenase
MAPLTAEQIAIVKATAPVLQEHGVTITTLFYNNLLAAHEELKNIFSLTSQATGRQPRALAGAVLAYATYVDDLPKLHHAVERIAHKHVSLQVTAPQYDVVGQFLMEAIGQVLGDAATPAIVDAWTAAYRVLADVFINREAEMYEANRKADNWVGWRKFKVIRREAESSDIASFYLAPLDGVKLSKYLPGQYISLQIFVPELGVLQSRQYSLSEAPKAAGEYYRVSVKAVEGEVKDHPGVISNLLHRELKVGDEVELSHPQGEFFVDPSDQSKEGKPIVLISAGVGATPLMAILESLTADSTVAGQKTVSRPVSWIHGSRSSKTLPFYNAVKTITKTNENVKAKIFLSNATPEEKLGEDYPFAQTRIDLNKLDAEKDLFLSNSGAEYFICGPELFMYDIRRVLRDMGVAKERINLELFATGDVVDA